MRNVDQTSFWQVKEEEKRLKKTRNKNEKSKRRKNPTGKQGELDLATAPSRHLSDVKRAEKRLNRRQLRNKTGTKELGRQSRVRILLSDKVFFESIFQRISIFRPVGLPTRKWKLVQIEIKRRREKKKGPVPMCLDCQLLLDAAMFGRFAARARTNSGDISSRMMDEIRF